MRGIIMAFYDWKFENNTNSIKSEDLKKVLEMEQNNTSEYNERFINSHILNKYRTFNEKRYLKYKFPELFSVLEKLANESLTSDDYYFNLDQNVTPESILQTSMNFYYFLQDQELMQEYFKFLSTQGSHIRIQKLSKDNPLNKYAQGRNIIDPKTNEIYISYYLTNSTMDYPSYMHETGHMLIASLYKDKVNPIIHLCFREFEADFMELLCCYFMGIEKNDPMLRDALISNMITTKLNIAFYYKIQDIILKHFFKPSDAKIKEEARKLGYDGNLYENKYFLERPALKCFDIVNSFLMALDLIINNIDDFEKAIYEYKQIITSKTDNILAIYNEHGITYHQDDCQNLRNELSKAKSLII